MKLYQQFTLEHTSQQTLNGENENDEKIWKILKDKQISHDMSVKNFYEKSISGVINSFNVNTISKPEVQ